MNKVNDYVRHEVADKPSTVISYVVFEAYFKNLKEDPKAIVSINNDEEQGFTPVAKRQVNVSLIPNLIFNLLFWTFEVSIQFLLESPIKLIVPEEQIRGFPIIYPGLPERELPAFWITIVVVIKTFPGTLI